MKIYNKINILLIFLFITLTSCAQERSSPQYVWDISIPWGSAVFHTKNAQKYADAIHRKTQGRLKINIHAGAVLGIKGPESLRAVGEGIADGADIAAFQQTGLEPILGLDALPFLIDSHEELALLYEEYRPLLNARLSDRNLIVLYTVPWPNQNIYVKTPVTQLSQLAGLTIRTYDAQSTVLMTKLGMTPMQMPSADVVPALATGALDSTMTSTTSGASQKYWEFLGHIIRSNHLWVTNIFAVNKDKFQKLSPDIQKIVLDTAQEMQDEFWRISKSDDVKQLKILTQNGIKVIIPSDQFMADMRTAATSMIHTFKHKNPDAEQIIDSFLRKKAAGEARRYDFSAPPPHKAQQNKKGDQK